MDSENINETVINARNDETIFSRFVKENRNFIASSAYSVTNKYVSEDSDVYSIALIAFHEAVKNFDESKGNFYSFAKIVITRRVTDYLRKETSYYNEIDVSMQTLNEDTGELNIKKIVRRKEAELAQDIEQDKKEKNDIREEINEVQQIFSLYGFSFYDLTSCSPKAEKTKNACAETVAEIINHEKLYGYMISNRSLPLNELTKICEVPRKIMERHRKYIIAAVIIMKGDYPLLQEYMHYIRKVMWQKQ